MVIRLFPALGMLNLPVYAPLSIYLFIAAFISCNYSHATNETPQRKNRPSRSNVTRVTEPHMFLFHRVTFDRLTIPILKEGSVFKMLAALRAVRLRTVNSPVEISKTLVEIYESYLPWSILNDKPLLWSEVTAPLYTFEKRERDAMDKMARKLGRNHRDPFPCRKQLRSSTEITQFGRLNEYDLENASPQSRRLARKLEKQFPSGF